MIKNQKSYEIAKRDVILSENHSKTKKQQLREEGLNDKQIELYLSVSDTFQLQRIAEIEEYERFIRGEFPTIYNLKNIGKLLIGYRIFLGWSEETLAKKLNVSNEVVLRDEKNEYYGHSIDSIQNIIDVMGMKISIKID